MKKLSFVITRGTDMSALVAGLFLVYPSLSFKYEDYVVKSGMFKKARKRKYVVIGKEEEIDELQHQLAIYSSLY